MQMMPMLPTARLARTLAKSVVAAALVLPAPLPGLAYADQPRPPPSVPGTIRVPARNVQFFPGHATGTQNYTCQPSSTGYEEPEATEEPSRRAETTRLQTRLQEMRPCADS